MKNKIQIIFCLLILTLLVSCDDAIKNVDSYGSLFISGEWPDEDSSDLSSSVLETDVESTKSIYAGADELQVTLSKDGTELSTTATRESDSDYFTIQVENVELGDWTLTIEIYCDGVKIGETTISVEVDSGDNDVAVEIEESDYTGVISDYAQMFLQDSFAKYSVLYNTQYDAIAELGITGMTLSDTDALATSDYSGFSKLQVFYWDWANSASYYPPSYFYSYYVGAATMSYNYSSGNISAATYANSRVVEALDMQQTTTTTTNTYTDDISLTYKSSGKIDTMSKEIVYGYSFESLYEDISDDSTYSDDMQFSYLSDEDGDDAFLESIVGSTITYYPTYDDDGRLLSSTGTNIWGDQIDWTYNWDDENTSQLTSTTQVQSGTYYSEETLNWSTTINSEYTYENDLLSYVETKTEDYFPSDDYYEYGKETVEYVYDIPAEDGGDDDGTTLDEITFTLYATLDEFEEGISSPDDLSIIEYVTVVSFTREDDKVTSVQYDLEVSSEYEIVYGDDLDNTSVSMTETISY